jgi:O-antigen/teichoic acid export membrane protein
VTGSQIQAEPRRAAPRSAGAATPKSPIKAAAETWRRHRDLLANAGTLVATTGLASLLGFGYWALAARLFSQRSVGYGSAAVSAMTLLGTIGMLGMGTVLIGELPRRSSRGGLVSAALIAASVGSLVLGVGFAILAPHVSGRFSNISGTLTEAAVFVAGVALTAVSLVFDQATIGLMRGGLQLSRNALFAVIKLAALPAAAIVFHDGLGLGITLSWAAGIALSLVLTAIRLVLARTSILPRPDWGVLRSLGRTALAHNWLNLSITVPQTLIPVLVTVIVSPSANAAFYAAWTLSGLLKIIPTHLSTVLFAVAAADPQVIARKLRFTLRLSLLIGLPGMAALALSGHLILGLFGPSYARAATVPLLLLVIGYLPSIPKVHYMAVCRATGRVPRAAAVLTGAAVAEVAAAAAGGSAGGLTGLSEALLVVFFIEGLVTVVPVLRAALGQGRHRRPGSVTKAASAPAAATFDGRLPVDSLAAVRRQPGTDPGPPGLQADDSITFRELAGASRREWQEAGLAALLSLAVGQPDSPGLEAGAGEHHRHHRH